MTEFTETHRGAADCAGSQTRLDEMERQRDATRLECRRLRDALIGLRALVKAEFPSMECVDIDKADSALSGGSKSCLWTEDTSCWQAGCGAARAFEFNDEGPEENNFSYCPYCGQPLVAIPADEDDKP